MAVATCVQVNADSVSNLPFSDPSLKFCRVSPVFMTMTDRVIKDTIVPSARAEIIRSQYPSDDAQRRQGSHYYIDVHPYACWEHLASILYMNKEKAAIRDFRRNLPKIIGNHHDCVTCGVFASALTLCIQSI